MTLQEAVSGYLIKPIRGLRRIDLLFGKAGQIESVVVSHILLCVHDVILVSDSLYAGISIIGYANFTLFTSFGRDDKYTIRALSTINSGGGGIFQDRYALDIVRLIEFNGSRSGALNAIPLLGALGVFTTKPSTTYKGSVFKKRELRPRIIVLPPPPG